MFESVARAGIHHQQVINLLKQRTKVHGSLIYNKNRIITLEQHLSAHIYALIDAEDIKLKPQVEILVDILKALITPCLTSEQLIQTFVDAENEQQANAITLLSGLLPKTLTFESSSEYINSLLYKHNALADLLVIYTIDWPSEQLKVLRQSVLSNQCQANIALSYLLFKQTDVTALELEQSYEHNNFDIAMAGFTRGLLTTDYATKAQTSLFNRFYKTENVLEKADILALGGLTGDKRWHEACLIFCQEYPDLSFNVLCHYLHKSSLILIIEAMKKAQTLQPAYQAWCVITDETLNMSSQVSDASDQHNNAGQQTVPNTDQAELIRQSLLQQPGDKILAGFSFDNSNAADFQGILIQRVLLWASGSFDKLEVFHRQLAAQEFTTMFPNQTATIVQGAQDVA